MITVPQKAPINIPRVMHCLLILSFTAIFLNNNLPDKCANLIIADPPYFEVKGLLILFGIVLKITCKRC